jgi:hypothetical protein
MPRNDGLEAARTALRAGMAERSLRHDDGAVPPIASMTRPIRNIATSMPR